MEIFKLSGVAFCLAQPIGGLLVQYMVTFADICNCVCVSLVFSLQPNVQHGVMTGRQQFQHHSTL